MPKEKSFTIIELLVVIAIIGLMSSIVLVNIDLPGQKQRGKIAKILEFSQSIQNALGAEAVGVWEFDNNALDTSGYSNNGTINGGATFTDNTPQKVVGTTAGKYALSFDGVNDYVQVADSNSLDITSAITISAWVNLTNVADNRQIVAKNNTGSGNNDPYAFAVSQTTGTISGRVGSGTNSNSVTGVKKVADGAWHFVVFSYDKNNLYLYVDGVLDKTGAKTITPLTNTTALMIGSWNNTWSRFYGLIDEVRIYNQTLTIGQIQKHYAEGLAKYYGKFSIIP